MLTLDKIFQASVVLKDIVRNTSIVSTSGITDNCELYLKPENLQYTGSFKLRGSGYKIAMLSDEEKAKGVIACSAGNHAQGVALAASKCGIKSLICLPDTAPISKVEATKSYGAEVCLVNGCYDDAYDEALRLKDEMGYTFVHPFDDLAVATGQGSIAMEIVKELPLVDYILVPIGGGGLATGVSTLAKLLNPKIKVIGVEPSGANCLQVSLK
ncbi:MAG: threonine/serine dehydratase, partial [Clostridia bacterium]|nr:threonine/serine dehydratase [Clostridia bacterium]